MIHNVQVSISIRRVFRPEYTKNNGTSSAIVSGSVVRRSSRDSTPRGTADAEHECAEDGVNADQVGEPRAAREQAEHGHERSGGYTGVALGRGRKSAEETGARRETRAPRTANAPPAADSANMGVPGEAAEHYRENDPGGGVVHGARGQGERSDGRAGDAALGDDAREHSETR